MSYRRRSRNADDKLRQLERTMIATLDKADVIAYWRACLRANVLPIGQSGTSHGIGRPWKRLENLAERLFWDVEPLGPTRLYISDQVDQSGVVKRPSEVASYTRSGSVVSAVAVFSLVEAKNEIMRQLAQIVETENPPFTLSSTQRAYQRGPSGLWRGEVKVYAHKKRTPVGKLYMNFGNITLAGRPVATVSWVEVPGEHQRRGIATALYRKAAEIACSRGYVLASDVQLRAGSRGFWEKQKRGGNATLHREKFGDKFRLRYMLDCPPRVNPWHKRRRRAD